MLTLGIFELFSKNVLQAFYGLMLILDGIIYGFIAKLYEVFMVIASAKIFSQDIFTDITNRIYVLIGVVMMFFLAYTLLRAIINPDGMNSDKNGLGKLVPNIVVSIILIALVPTIFTYLYKAQNVIVQNNLIGRIIVGRIEDVPDDVPYNVSYTDANGQKSQIASGTVKYTEENMQQGYVIYGGTGMAQLVFQTFFYRNEGYTDDDTKISGSVLKAMGYGGLTALSIGCAAAMIAGVANSWWTAGTAIAIGVTACLGMGIAGVNGIGDQVDLISQGAQTLDSVSAQAYATGDFSLYSAFAADNLISDGVIHYSWFLSTVAGIFVCYVLLSFCIDLGLRAVKLGYFQIIAPIPILARILPSGKKIFDDWVKKLTSTFAGIFIRLLIIFLVVYLIQKLPTFNLNLDAGITSSSAVSLFARLAVILGLLMFAKQAPKLISDMFGLKDGDMKLGIKDKLMDLAPLRPMAATGAAISTGIKNFNAYKGKGFGARVGSAIAGGASGFRRGYALSKDAKTMGDVRSAATKATQAAIDKRDMRALYRAEHASPTAGHIEDFMESTKKWAGVGISIGDEARLKQVEKRIKTEKEIEENRKAIWDFAGSMLDANKNEVKVKFEDTDFKTALNLTETGSALEAVLRQRLGNGYQNMSYAEFKKLKNSTEDKLGNKWDYRESAGIDSLFEKKESQLKVDYLNGVIGKDVAGKWSDAITRASGEASSVLYNPTLAGKISELQTTVQNATKVLGDNHELYKNDLVKLFNDKEKNWDTPTNGDTVVTIDGKDYTLGSAIKGMKQVISNQTAVEVKELSKLKAKIDERKDDDKK